MCSFRNLERLEGEEPTIFKKKKFMNKKRWKDLTTVKDSRAFT